MKNIPSLCHVFEVEVDYKTGEYSPAKTGFRSLDPLHPGKTHECLGFPGPLHKGETHECLYLPVITGANPSLIRVSPPKHAWVVISTHPKYTLHFAIHTHHFKFFFLTILSISRMSILSFSSFLFLLPLLQLTSSSPCQWIILLLLPLLFSPQTSCSLLLLLLPLPILLFLPLVPLHPQVLLSIPTISVHPPPKLNIERFSMYTLHNFKTYLMVIIDLIYI